MTNHSPASWDTLTLAPTVDAPGSALTRQMTALRDLAPVPVPPVLATPLVEVGTDGRLYPAMMGISTWGGDQHDVYAGNAHAEAERIGVPTCLDPVTYALGSCVACEVEEGLALMVTYPRS